MSDPFPPFLLLYINSPFYWKKPLPAWLQKKNIFTLSASFLAFIIHFISWRFSENLILSPRGREFEKNDLLWALMAWSSLPWLMRFNHEIFSHFCVQWCHVDSLKSVIVVVVMPQKSASMTYQGSPIPCLRGWVVKYLPGHLWLWASNMLGTPLIFRTYIGPGLSIRLLCSDGMLQVTLNFMVWWSR